MNDAEFKRHLKDLVRRASPSRRTRLGDSARGRTKGVGEIGEKKRAPQEVIWHWLSDCTASGMPAKVVTPGDVVFVPQGANLPELWDAAQKCHGCDLYRHATHAVLGEGPPSARIVMVGEQPGDKEDLAGHPFVGPAGALLDRALGDAGIDRSDVYVTNAVKHFKFEERGKRRIHKKPSMVEIVACKPWSEAEMAVVQPALIVCLGATAARAVIGPKHHLLKERGRFFDHPWSAGVTATVHPSAVLRSPDDEQRHANYQAFVNDLIAVRKRLSSVAKAHLTLR